jgi:hypothetical protein
MNACEFLERRSHFRCQRECADKREGAAKDRHDFTRELVKRERERAEARALRASARQGRKNCGKLEFFFDLLKKEKRGKEMRERSSTG